MEGREEHAQCAQDFLHIWCVRLHHHDYFRASQRLEAVQREAVCVERINSGAPRCWRQLPRDSVQGVPTW